MTYDLGAPPPYADSSLDQNRRLCDNNRRQCFSRLRPVRHPAVMRGAGDITRSSAFDGARHRVDRVAATVNMRAFESVDMDTQWLHVKVHPNAGKDVLVAMGPGRFEAWVKAKPMDGHANDAVIGLLVRDLKISAGSLRLVKGRSRRHKIFKVISA